MGGGTAQLSGDTTYIGYGTRGNGTLAINGGLLSNDHGAIGMLAGSTGRVTVSGGQWQNSGTIKVGDAGSSTLQIDGGTVSSNGATIGQASGSTGTVTCHGRLGNHGNALQHDR